MSEETLVSNNGVVEGDAEMREEKAAKDSTKETLVELCEDDTTDERGEKTVDTSRKPVVVDGGGGSGGEGKEAVSCSEAGGEVNAVHQVSGEVIEHDSCNSGVASEKANNGTAEESEMKGSSSESLPKDDKEEDSKESEVLEGGTSQTETNDEKSEASDINNKELQAKIIRQIEYYFGDYNLPRDKFLQEEVKKDDGWISLETMVKFKRLASLSTDFAVIKAALNASATGLMEVHEDGQKIRRSPTRPLPDFGEDMREETVKRTIYCKGFPKDGSVTLDVLLEYFEPYGPFETVHMRRYFDRTHGKQGFKGSVLVVFPDEEKAKKFFMLPDIKYKGMTLLRKWYAKYLAEKKAEIEERKARREARKAEAAAGAEEKVESVPKGCFLHATGFGPTITRNDIKESISQLDGTLAYIEFNVGDKEAYLRFSEEGSNKEILEKLQGKLKVQDSEIKLRLVEGEEEEEQIAKANEARLKSQMNIKRKSSGQGGGRSRKKRRN